MPTFWKDIIGAAALSVALLSGAGVAKADSAVLSKVTKEATFTIGYREASIPFSYLNETRQPIGYSIDLCLKIAERVKERLGLSQLTINYVPVTAQTRIALVANGTIDVECGSTTNNLSRQQQVAFSPIIFVTGTKLLVKKESGIKSIADLKDKIVAVAQGGANGKAIEAAASSAGFTPRFFQAKDNAEAFLAVQTDRADAFASDDIQLFGMISKAPSPAAYEVVGPLLSYEPYGIMLRRDDPDFELLVRGVLAEQFRSGEISKTYDKWFGPLGVPMSDLFRAAVTLQSFTN